ncbi:MAG: glycosyl transferase [Spirochaetes bacterium]|nr:glycosyl transferase [Spirochaetota bacterium]
MKQIHFCTFFDRNYLIRGLALHASLLRQCQKPFTLWILCFDDETYNILSELNPPNVRLITHYEFEDGDNALIAAKNNRTRIEYYWTCTPSLPLYILRYNPEVDLITYLDADLYFFSDPQPIFDEMGDASILIIEHRYASEHRDLEKKAGIYNVGWVSFRHDINGQSCLTWWRERCLEWCHKRTEDNRFGDQLYLDDWPQRFKNVAVLQHKGANVAPWNVTSYQVQQTNGLVTIDGYPLIFFHFHGFHFVHSVIIEPASYRYNLPINIIKHIVLPYSEQLFVLHKTIKNHCNTDNKVKRRMLIYGTLIQRLLVLRPRFLTLWLWKIGGVGRSLKKMVYRIKDFFFHMITFNEKRSLKSS